MRLYCQESYDCNWSENENWTCACQEASPTPSPTPTSTPDDRSGKHSYLGKNGPTCEKSEFEVTFDTKEDGNARKDIEVKFTYRGEVKNAKTNDGGRATVYFNYSGEGELKADPGDGYPSQSLYVDKLDCPAQAIGGTGIGGRVLGVREATTSGQVLGATTDTLAGTGTFTQDLSINLLGLALGVVAFIAFRKKIAFLNN